jgi:hypothetical protein
VRTYAHRRATGFWVGRSLEVHLDCPFGRYSVLGPITRGLLLASVSASQW